MKNMRAITTILFIVAGCTPNTDPELQQATGCETELQSVRYAPVVAELGDFTDAQRLPGEIVIAEDQSVSIHLPDDAMLLSVDVRLGDYVRSGDILARAKSNEWFSLRSERTRVDARISLIKSELERLKRLLSREMSTGFEVMAKETELLEAEAEKAAVDDRWKRFGGGENSNGEYLIRAPQSGFIVEKNAVSGTEWNAEQDTPLIRIATLDEVRMEMQVYETHIRHIHLNMPVRVRLVSYPGEFFDGKIVRIPPVMDPEANVLRVSVALDNASGKLKPGMFGTGEYNLTYPNAVSVPESAIVFEDGAYHVVVMNEACAPQIRQVTLMPAAHPMPYILDGLEPGDKVASSAALRLFHAILKEQP